MSDGKEECERLMNEAVPFAEKMLRKHKAFYPYAYVLRPNGEIALVAGYGLIEGAFGSRRWMQQIGQRGGSSRSSTKAKASRENGKRGGRPKQNVAA